MSEESGNAQEGAGTGSSAGRGWKPEDLEKFRVIIGSTHGDSHPGSGHLEGNCRGRGDGAGYFCTDICDGESQCMDGSIPWWKSGVLHLFGEHAVSPVRKAYLE